MTVITTHLQPPLPSSSTNLTLHSQFSAQSNSIVIFPTATSSSSNAPSTTTKAPKPTQVYVAQYSNASLLERRSFILESYTVFASLQKIAQEIEDEQNGSSGGYRPVTIQPQVLGEEQLKYFNRISRLYKQAIVQQIPIIEADQTLSQDDKIHQLSHQAILLSSVSLTEILYLPSDGKGDGIVGEEILDWVNTTDRAPSAEEGTELASSPQPWLLPTFWSYIYRCILRGHLLSVRALLRIVHTSHPSALVQNLTSLILSTLSSFPRTSDPSKHYETESQWEREWLNWKGEVGSVWDEMLDLLGEGEEDQVLGGEEGEEDRLEWEAAFRCLVELLEGREKRVLEASEDWRECLGAWGLWVNPSGRREDLPDTLALILEHHPIDSTLPSESLQASLIQGDAVRALQQANLISTWLVAHLADLFSKLHILPVTPPPTSSIPASTSSLRDYFVLSYADSLLSDSSLWRVVVDYLITCGAVGRARVEKVLESVWLEDLPEEKKVTNGNGEEEMEGSEKENVEPKEGKSRIVEEVLRVCGELGLEESTKRVCKIYSEILVGKKRYGEAVSFCVRAGDPKRIARIADRVLDEYVVNGQEAFISHVDSIPTSLLRPTSSSRMDLANSDIDIDDEDEEEESTSAPPISRLAFLARYRDFFALYARGERREAASLLLLLLTSGITPKRFYAVIFLDVLPLLQAPEILVSLGETYELLRCLEEITSTVSASDGEDIYGYLIPLASIVGGKGLSGKEGTKVAMKQLDIVRGALALNLGRCCAL